jgi:two-component system LytT family response regulator
MNILIVDDERPARAELERSLRSLAVTCFIENASSITEAMELLAGKTPDVILLDIQMPGGDGFELLKRLGKTRPPVIFTTAYEQFAAQAFEEEAVDYLLKPFSTERLAMALARLNPNWKENPKLGVGDSILLKLGGECLLVPVEEIELLETTGNTTHVFWGSKTGKMNKSLKSLADRLHPDLFFRASRDQLVNLGSILSIAFTETGLVQALLQCQRTVTFSRRQSSLFLKKRAL